MNNMYQNLGDLLNQAIKEESLLKKEDETGDENNLKNENSCQTENKTTVNPQNHIEKHTINYNENNFAENETSESFENSLKVEDFLINKDNQSGEIIKLHKYTDFMQFPVDIQNALTTLDIAYPFSIESIKKQYRNLIKKYHPDTVKTENKQEITIQISENVYKTRQLSINELTSAYKLLIDYFSV